MKVLMVISQFYPIIGGAEKQAQLLAKKLIEKGIDITIATGWWNFGTPRKEVIDGIPVVRNFALWRMFGIKGVRFLGALAHMVSLGMFLRVHGEEYDLIHVHQVLYPAFIAVLVGKGMLRKPVLAKSACSGITNDIRHFRRFPFGGLQLKYVVKRMDSLIALNLESANEFKAIGYPETRTVLIPNGVAIPPNGKADYRSIRQVITAVRLDKQKGIDVLLKAWSEVVREEKGVQLVILGKGPLESELKKLSKSLLVSDTVKFAGAVHDVERYLSDSDLFILPSRAEGLSNALLEAMSYGIPCIATTVAGSGELLEPAGKEVLPGEYATVSHGVLVNPDDVRGLSQAIVYLIRNGAAREDLGEKGRAFVQEKYSIDLVADKYLALYQCMLGRRF